MSLRADKGEPQLRKSGRSGSSGHNRGYSGGGRGGGGGGGGGGGAHPPVSSASPALPTSRSFKKPGNGQPVQSRVNTANPISDAAVALNGAHRPASVHGFLDAPAPIGSKPVDTPAGSSRVPPKAPVAAGASDRAPPKTPPKGDASRGFSLQFGSISPGIMNGMQIPARTSSAPPKLDEQKQEQARHDAFRALAGQQAPAAQKQQQQQTRKDVAVNQLNSGESRPPTQTKRELNVAVQSAPALAPPKPSVLPVGGMPMPMPYQMPQVPLQFGGPRPQMQSQGVSVSSLQMTMALPVGNPPQAPQQMFIPGIHSHSLQAQAMMHQGQGVGFVPHMAHQMAPQLGNIGVGIPPQFSQQQQPGNFGGQRKTTVKITHPDTHEELRLDKRTDSYADSSSSGQRPPPNVNPQSQHIPSFASAHQINYYPSLQPSSYNAPIFFPSTSVPLTSTQMATGAQAQRYNYPVSQGGQVISFMDQSVLNSMPGSKLGPSPHLHGATEAVNLEGFQASSAHAAGQVTVRPPIGSYAEKAGTPSVKISAPVSKTESYMATNTSLGKPAHSVTISTPVNRTATSVIISKPSSKTEPSVTVRPVNKIEPTVTPVNTSEAPNLSKASEDTNAGQMQSEAAPLSSFRHPKPVSEPSADISVSASDSCSTVLPAKGSTQIAQPETSSSVPATPVGDSGSVVTITDGRKKDTVRRSESFKEHQRKLSKKDSKQSMQLHRTEASGFGEGTQLSSSKLLKDNSIIDSTQHVSDRSENIQPSISEGSEDIQAPLVADSSISTMILPSQVEAIVSPEVEKSEAVKDQEPDVLSGVVVEKEASEDSSSLCTVVYHQSKDEAYIKHCGSSEASSSVFREVDIAMRMNSHSSFSPEESLLVELEQKQELLAGMEHEKIEVSNDSSLDTSSCKAYLASTKAESLVKEEGTGAQSSECAAVCDLNDGEKQKSATCTEANDISLEGDRAPEELATTKSLESIHVEPVSSCNLTIGDANEDKCSPPDTLSKCEVTSSQDVVSIDLGISATETSNLPALISSDLTQKQGTEVSNLDTFPVVASGTKGKPSVEPTRSKTTGGIGKKKKRKEIFSKADAAGASDLYNAYKGPEEKQEVAITSESADSSLSVDAKHNVSDKTAVTSEEDGPSKNELDDWEDAADISTPKLKTSENVKQVNKHQNEDGGDATSKKYSRDFLLTLAVQCTCLPMGFDIGPDVAVALLNAQGGSYPHPSPGRTMDRPSGGPRGDRRTGAILDDGKWTKGGGSFGPGGDVRGDGGHGVTITNFRPGQVVNHGVLRNPRGQQSNQFPAGILSAPMHSPSQGGGQRNNIESDRWQRAPGTQRGLMPSPQTPLQVMHKAERKYEIGKVSDEEEGKQRQLKAILNKLTPQNFEKLFAQVIEVNIDNRFTLEGIISQIFDKALMEPTFCEMYANFCFRLADALPGFGADNEKITFKRMLLTKCQDEFEKGEREQEEANKIEEEGEIKQSEHEREEKRLRVRRRMLGNIRLIGELFKKKMLTERIMHSCINKLLGQQQNPDEEDLEALCKLMSTIGEMIDHSKAKGIIDAYYDLMQKLSVNQKYSSRVRFLLRDAIDLRKNKWQQRRKVEGPKTIEEVHRDAAQERAQPSRSSRGPAISSGGRRGQPVDYGPRGSSVLSSPSSQQIGSVRNLPSQNRGYAQDIRLADRHQFDNRAVPLQQRSVNSDSITLGPQGGLARGMSIRGQPLIPNVPSEMHPSISDPHRLPSGSNGYGAISDRAPYSSKEEMLHRSTPGRSSGDHILSRLTAVPLSSGRPIISNQNMPSVAKTLSEESLREKSIAAIREFYSAKDVEEVVLCVKELNTPSYHPSMVSLWVEDSFERKDMERNLLAKLLVKLSKAHDSLLSQMQLIQGFESVLSSLEDAVNDAPRAAEFLGRILAEVIVEDVVSLRDIGKLIHEGGEEPGRLLQIGLASEVLAGILEFIRAEKGESVLNEIRTVSSLKLEDFRPPHPMKSKKLDTFIEG